MAGTVFCFEPASLVDIPALPPHVTGVSHVFPWSRIEAVPGVYDWSAVDAAIAATHATGRVSMLRIVAGSKSPASLAGQVTITFTPSGPLGPRTITCPIPWDPGFLAAFCNFIAAYGSRYDNDPRVGIVQMPGCGWLGEFALADDGHWISARGYTDAKIETAWEQIIAAYVNAFPLKLLALDVGEALLKGSAMMQPVHDYALAKAPRIALQQNGLRARPDKWTTLFLADSTRTNTGRQAWGTVASIGGGATIAQLLQVAQAQRAAYVEIYEADCTAANDRAFAQFVAASPSFNEPPDRRVATQPRREVAEMRLAPRRVGKADRRGA